jgi:integrase
MSIMIDELVALHERHARTYYRNRSGRQTREADNFRSILRSFCVFTSSDADATKINRHQVRAWLDQLAEDHSRTYVNTCLRKLRTFVRWAADLDHIPPSIVADLSLIRAAQPGRTQAREPSPIQHIEDERVREILRVCVPWVRTVCQLIMLTGARPGEILNTTTSQIRLDDMPAILPSQHKLAHRNITRVIPLSSRALALITPHLKIFTPEVPLFCNPRTGEAYTNSGLNHAIDRAATEQGLPSFNPNQLRHTVAVKITEAHGLTRAAEILGHKSTKTTERYAPVLFNRHSYIGVEGLS